MTAAPGEPGGDSWGDLPVDKRVASAWASGVDTIAAYFGPGVADYVRRRYGPARLLIVRSVRAGGDELAHFLAAGARCLGPSGAIVILSAGVNALVEVRPDPLAPVPVPLPRAA